jgi:hypothetical protein
MVLLIRRLGPSVDASSLSTLMPSHKFEVGDVVTLRPVVSLNVPGGTYQVTRQLPENRGEFEYRIKNLEEAHERVVRESELTRAT